MCGITGTLNFDGRPADPGETEAMVATLRHRGPNDTGVITDGPASLGIARLSVIDLETGHQPIHNEDRSVHAVVNGEIYNYQALREDLSSRGHQFHTRSDAEVVVHLYEEYGEQFPEYLRGMFAIALWDSNRRRLVLVRDRLGVKPLFYCLEPGRLVFGSELKALLAGGIPRTLDLQGADDYLTYGYIPDEESIFQNVRKLGAAHTLVCEHDGSLRKQRYWDVLDPRWDDEHRAAADPKSRGPAFWDLFKQAVRLRLASDVPLGVLLSGGIDSSAVLAAIREVTGRPIKTFTVGFPDQSYDESALARLTARHFGAEHHELIAQPDDSRIVSHYIRHFDEPYGESSAIPIYYLAGMAAREITVAIGGDGGDELMGGYNHHFASLLMARYNRLPAPLSRRLIPWVVNALPVSHSRASFEHLAKRFVSAADASPEQAQLRWLEIISADAKQQLYGPLLRDRPGKLPAFRFMEEAFLRARALTPLNRLLYADQQIYLRDGILAKVDRMTMAHGLESRGPFLDHKLAEFAMRLPDECKIRGWRRKVLLKQLLRRKLPPRVRRRKKMGFVIPLAQWLAGDLNQLLRDTLSADSLRREGIFDPGFVQRLIGEHSARERDHSKALWGILVFTLWLRTYAGAPRKLV